MALPVALPRYADTVVVSGGSAGAAVAGLLAERSDASVLLLEAGPDFGPYDSGRWPADLLDARALGYTLDWRYDSGEAYPGRVVRFERARVIGGCSAHNGCAAIWGSRVDYDAWADRGLVGWSADDLLPAFRAADARLRVRRYAPAEVTPFQQACLDAAVSVGIPLAANLNDLDEDVGMAPSPVNIVDGVRWNAAFAYLDPVRDRQNLTISGDAPVVRLVIEGARVAGVEVTQSGDLVRVDAGRVIVCAGTYGSPAILLRSGIGDPEDLRAAGVAPVHALPGVGRNLHDHPSVSLRYGGTPALERAMRAFAEERWMPEEQTIAKLRSPRYPSGERGFDLHVYPVGGPDADTATGWGWKIPLACMTPRSRGAIRLRAADPTVAPWIDHGYLNDADGHDRRILIEGVGMVREIAARPELGRLLGAETEPAPAVAAEADLLAWIDATCQHYYHPVGTCAMGDADDAAAVVDACGRIHGFDNGYVADCSIMPTIPRANTNVPAVVVGERVAGWLVGG